MIFVTHTTPGSMHAGHASKGASVVLAGVAEAAFAAGVLGEGVYKPWPCAPDSSLSLDGRGGRNQQLDAISAIGAHGTQNAQEKGFSEEVTGDA